VLVQDLTLYVFAGSQLLATIEGGTIKYHHADHLSVRLSTDASGSVGRRFGHYPFGETWYEAGTADKWKFTSYERDTESGLDYAMFRYESSRLGRFMTPDPMAGAIQAPQSLNRYAYVTNDPVNLIDPFGLCVFQWELWCNPDGTGCYYVLSPCTGDSTTATGGFGNPFWFGGAVGGAGGGLRGRPAPFLNIGSGEGGAGGTDSQPPPPLQTPLQTYEDCLKSFGGSVGASAIKFLSLNTLKDVLIKGGVVAVEEGGAHAAAQTARNIGAHAMRVEASMAARGLRPVTGLFGISARATTLAAGLRLATIVGVAASLAATAMDEHCRRQAGLR
jgi:RHS repeat-associated protein